MTDSAEQCPTHLSLLAQDIARWRLEVEVEVALPSVVVTIVICVVAT